MMLRELEQFIAEDVGDELLLYTFPDVDTSARVIVKGSGILAGLEEVKQIFGYFGLSCSSDKEDGKEIDVGDIVLTVRGSSKGILSAERLTLNFLGRMSGIATLTRDFIEAAKSDNKNVTIAGTRKTTPGFRKYEKKAIMLGGGDPHRFNLSDAILIKDNHIKIFGLEEAIKCARKNSFTKKIEVEVESVEDGVEAARLSVDIIMFDNMPPGEIKKAMDSISEHVITEASGGITLENVKRYAECVDVISVGALTHASRWLDFTLEIDLDQSTFGGSERPEGT
jgi:nicotinate-nucleotide pyrophosphorylase (carboxylating)